MESSTTLRDGISIFHNFVALHKLQLESSGVPGHFWEVLFKKLHNQVFDAGETFSILRLEYEEERTPHDPLWKVVVSAEKGVCKHDANQIYLIDHAWTYKVSAAKTHLREIPGLLERMMNLMGLEDNSEGSTPSEESIEKVFNEMWRYNQTYAIGAVSEVEERMPIWYIMDEFGSAIQHSDQPSFRAVPFIHMQDQVTYTLLFPIEDLEQGGEVTRNYVEGYIKDPLARKALLLPWKPESFLEYSFEQEEPDSAYFLEGHIAESMPNYQVLKSFVREEKSVLKVYSEYSFVNTYLTHPKFEVVDNEDEADILWYTAHFKNFKEFSERYPCKFVNQFPFEHVITVKDLLSIVCQRHDKEKEGKFDPLDSYPLWLPKTYNLKTEIPKFVSYYQHREEKGLDNHWICKPFNLARGLDTHITNNLNYILRLPFTGPKIAQKYIENPVLFTRPEIGLVKFDIRYVVLLKSISPLKAFAYKNFFLRFANKPFELRDFDNYEKHFTVMNYNENANLCRMLCDEFIEQFESQHDRKWSTVEHKIFEMLHDMFRAASSKNPPAGIAHNPQSRALYAVDLMLSWKDTGCDKQEMQPKLLEVNWVPDCRRACEYYPDFYNDIFALLFLDDMKEQSFQLLTSSS